MIPAGNTVTWTYVVTNTGQTDLTGITVTDSDIGPISCPVDTLAPGASTTCTATGVATAGQYANEGTATGTDPLGATHDDTDPSHYYGTVTGGIDIEKATNGVDADTPTGPMIPAGNTVTWTYVVTNTTNVDLTGITVTDSDIGPISCPVDTLAPGASTTCTATRRRNRRSIRQRRHRHRHRPARSDTRRHRPVALLRDRDRRYRYREGDERRRCGYTNRANDPGRQHRDLDLRCHQHDECGSHRHHGHR